MQFIICSLWLSNEPDLTLERENMQKSLLWQESNMTFTFNLENWFKVNPHPTITQWIPVVFYYVVNTKFFYVKINSTNQQRGHFTIKSRLFVFLHLRYIMFVFHVISVSFRTAFLQLQITKHEVLVLDNDMYNTLVHIYWNFNNM